MFLPSILCIMNDSNITSQSPYRVVLLNEEDYEEVIMGRSHPSDIFLPSESVVGVRTSTSDDDKYRWLKQDDAEAFLGRKTCTLWRYVKIGRLHVRKKLGRNYYDRRELITLLHSEQNNALR